ncbi:MAG: hypothetical protein HFJ80_02450 [Clostridiales bacterium]|nr:hypothetical protein [Clostridiales bacterium]
MKRRKTPLWKRELLLFGMAFLLLAACSAPVLWRYGTDPSRIPLLSGSIDGLRRASGSGGWKAVLSLPIWLLSGTGLLAAKTVLQRRFPERRAILDLISYGMIAAAMPVFLYFFSASFELKLSGVLWCLLTGIFFLLTFGVWCAEQALCYIHNRMKKEKRHNG